MFACFYLQTTSKKHQGAVHALAKCYLKACIFVLNPLSVFSASVHSNNILEIKVHCEKADRP